jgi:hypothetical protein
MMKRIASKYADFGLTREANALYREALSGLRNGQSALTNPRPTNTGRQETSIRPALGPKSLKERARLPSPSEQDSMFTDLVVQDLESLLAGKSAKDSSANQSPD